MNILQNFAKSVNFIQDPIPLEIGILSNGYGYTTPMVIEKLNKTNKANAIPYSPPEDDEALTKEVTIWLKYIKENNLEANYASRSQAFLELVKSRKIDAPRSLKVIETIQEQAKKFDAIFLPGGGDIPSIWYEDKIDDTFSVYEDQYRTLIELTLISEARKRGIPLMGVCRGFQILNIFHGEKLKDNLYQEGIRKIELFDDEKKGLLADLFRQGVRGQVMHMQGVAIEEFKGKGDLEPLAGADGLLEAAESKFSAASPIIAIQFHAECYETNDFENADITSNNEEFFNILYESAITYRSKQQITPKDLIEARQKLCDATIIKDEPKSAAGFITAYFWNLVFSSR